MSCFIIRRAAPADAAVIAAHRARMFEDMEEVPPGLFEALRARSECWIESALESGEYVGWLGIAAKDSMTVAGGGGVQLRRVPPHLRANQSGAISVAEGRHAIVLNVFTEPAWRRRGLAALLMQEILSWARGEQLDRLVLHASTEGRRLYENLGFVPTNEMRYNAL